MDMDTAQMAEQLTKLEAKIAHLEYAYDQLNEVVIAQQKILTRLQADAQRLGESMRTIEIDRIHANTQKPPHYQ
jgi:uncharacterized coiled-coil protein SlyX